MASQKKKLQQEFTAPPQEVVDDYRAKLVNDFKTTANFDGDPEAVAAEIIEKALKGWGRAPKEFKDRIDRLVRLRANSKSLQKKPVDKNKIKERNKSLLEDRAYTGQFTDSLLSQLNPMEQQHYLEREKFYVEEFEFNMSSDLALLNNMLMEEIIIRRIQLEILKSGGGDKEMSQRLSEAQKRHMEALKSLGITRDQRKHEKGKGEGSVAALSKDLDEKLALRKKELENEQAVEAKYLESQKQRDPVFRGIHTENSIRDADIDNLVQGMKNV